MFGGDETPECVAWTMFYDTTAEKGTKELSVFPFEELATKDIEFCSKDKRNKSPCTVWGNVLTEQTKDIIKDLDIFDMEKRKKEFCDRKALPYSVCDAWQKKHNQDSEALVKIYVDNFDLFKEFYNLCVDAVAETNSSKAKWDEKHEALSKIKFSAPCQQTSYAHGKRGLGYGDFKKKIN